jgi:hypothetical protein
MTHHTDTPTATEVVYHGQHTGRGGIVHLETPDGQVLGQLPHVIRYSPTGLNWGYTGSGPADCARSILLHALGDDALCGTCAGTTTVVHDPRTDQYRPSDPARATGHDTELVSRCWDCLDGHRPVPYQRFMADLVAHWLAEWRISRSEVLAWLHRTEQHPTTFSTA